MNDLQAPQYVLNFNPDDYFLAACYMLKYHGGLNTAGSQMIGTNDMIYYRLPAAILGLAECENYLGNDPSLLQTWGYTYPSDPSRTQQWIEH